MQAWLACSGLADGAFRIRARREFGAVWFSESHTLLMGSSGCSNSTTRCIWMGIYILDYSGSRNRSINSKAGVHSCFAAS